MTKISDDEFDSLLEDSLLLAAGLDYCRDMPPDDEIEIPVRIVRKMQKLIRNPIGYVRRLTRPMYMRTLRTAVTILIALSVALGATMAVPQARAAIIDFVRSWFSDRTEYKIVGAPKTTLGEWKLGYIPEEFELIEAHNDNLQILIKYASVNAERLIIKITDRESVPHIDNEHSDLYQTAINGFMADVYESTNVEYSNHIILFAERENVIISITSEIKISELIKVAENIVPQ